MAASNTARTVKLWEDALRKIDQLPAGSPSVGYSQQHAAGGHLTLQDGILPTVDEFVELPKLHPAVWTKLLAELKVGCAVQQPTRGLSVHTTICCSAMQELCIEVVWMLQATF